MDGVFKTVCVSKDDQFGLHVVEGQQSFITVYIDADPRRSGGDCQADGRIRSEGVVGPIPQAEEPVAVGGAHWDFTLSNDGPARYSQVPVGFTADIHLEEDREGNMTVTFQVINSAQAKVKKWEIN